MGRKHQFREKSYKRKCNRKQVTWSIANKMALISINLSRNIQYPCVSKIPTIDENGGKQLKRARGTILCPIKTQYIEDHNQPEHN